MVGFFHIRSLRYTCWQMCNFYKDLVYLHCCRWCVNHLMHAVLSEFAKFFSIVRSPDRSKSFTMHEHSHILGKHGTRYLVLFEWPLKLAFLQPCWHQLTFHLSIMLWMGSMPGYREFLLSIVYFLRLSTFPGGILLANGWVLPSQMCHWLTNFNKSYVISLLANLNCRASQTRTTYINGRNSESPVPLG
jgi:hypothetical protein